MNGNSLPSKSIVFYTNSGDDALAVIRVVGPTKQLGVRLIKGVDHSQIKTELVREGNLVILQRDFCLNLEAYEQILSLARSLHIPVILDLDDLLLELPEDHPDRQRFHFTHALLPMLQAIMEVDLITVATTALRDYFLPFNKNIVVIPNFLNDDLWSFKEPTISDSLDEEITIGYMGGHSHRPDLLMVLPALLNVQRRYPQRVQFKFWGIEPPDELAPFSKVDWFPPTSLDYSDFVSYFLTQTADIMIAPLCDNLFNSCKSPIKFLEYSAFGKPGVYSRLKPYSDIVNDGKNGLLASSISEWENSLIRLIEDRELRSKIAQNAQRKTKEDWLLSKNVHRHQQIFEDAIKNFSQKSYPDLPIYRTIKSLSHQIHEVLENKNYQISEEKRNLDALIEESLIDKKKIESITVQSEEYKNVIEIMDTKLIECNQKNLGLSDQADKLKQENLKLSDQTDQLARENLRLSDQADKLKRDNFKLLDQTDELARENLRLSDQIDDLIREILSYALSKSWILTRPWRMLTRMIKKILKR